MPNDPNLNKNGTIDPYNLPSNNKKSKEIQEKKTKKVISGEVTEKKSFGKKFSETFLAGDLNSVKEYLITDVLIPTIRDTLSAVLHGSLDVLFGDSGRRRDRSGKTYVSYDGFSRRSSRRDRDEPRRSEKRGRFDAEDYLFSKKSDAEDVFNTMIDIFEEYNQVTVGDFLDSIGKTGDYTTENHYGWTNLSDVKVKRIRDGYILDLPRPVLLK